jgi:hypothetical protein
MKKPSCIKFSLSLWAIYWIMNSRYKTFDTNAKEQNSTKFGERHIIWSILKYAMLCVQFRLITKQKLFMHLKQHLNEMW